MPYFDPEDPTEEANHWLSLLLGRAIHSIDERFGDGHAKSNPGLVGAYLEAGSRLIASKQLGSDVGSIAGSLSDVSTSLDHISDNIPSFPETE